MAALYASLATLLVAVVSGLVTLLVARRSKSGRIDTSEAAKLWDEGTAMRLELRSEVATLRAQLSEATTSIAELNIELRKARTDAARARKEAIESRRESQELIEQIKQLKGAVEDNSKRHQEEKDERDRLAAEAKGDTDE